MLRLILLNLSILISCYTYASNKIVANKKEIELANTIAKPGDTIILKNGNWENITLKLNCKGNKDKPIVFKAEIKGKVIITGNSQLYIGGEYIIVDGLYFTKGYSGEDAVIQFSINKNEIANNCRVTNSVINDFNNPKRLNENYWVAFYGKHNRIDHCTFINKKNLGVLMAVILEDERSRENYHSIDHNYFGYRTPLASNAGEIIRIGVSEHCEFNSNTTIADNYFEKCDGEAEIISVKSGKNIVKNNVFKECQGAVVLRHGNYNTIANNIFLGNGKDGTGGVRVINKGHIIINNYFYKCRGVDFRSPLAIMNGVPNSPAKRYVGVSDAVIANNSFYDCTPISFCEGTNAERSLQPKNVKFINNLFYSKKDETIYHIYDDISGIQFVNNAVSKEIKNNVIAGFNKIIIETENISKITIPKTIEISSNIIIDSIQKLISSEINTNSKPVIGYFVKDNFDRILQNAYYKCGANWYTFKAKTDNITNINCSNTQEILDVLDRKDFNKLKIHLTNSNYIFNSSVSINKDVEFVNDSKSIIKIECDKLLPYIFEIKGSHQLTLNNLNLNLSSLKSTIFITSDTSGTSDHSNFVMQNCSINNFKGAFFKATKSSLLDSIVVNNCVWTNGNGILFNLYDETDKKGYYNVEKMIFSNNSILNHNGAIIAILRSGTDESTLGPLLKIINNKFTSITDNSNPLLLLNGVQQSLIEKNTFTNCNSTSKMIEYIDEVRAMHFLSKNILENCGIILKNEYVMNK